MTENFVNSFMSTLVEDIPNKYLTLIREKLFRFVSNYDISRKENSVNVYTGYLPEFYKIYFATLKIEGAKETTLQLYHLRLNNFFQYMNKDVKEISTNDIRIYLYIAQQQRQITNRTLDNTRTIINTFFEWAVNEKYIVSNPCKPIRAIKYICKEREPLTGFELEKIRDSCQTIREKCLVEFLYSTGARVTEVVRLKKSDINFEKSEVLLFGKGDKYRKSYLSPRCKFYLEKYLSSRTDVSNSLFVSERNPHDGLKKEAIEKIIRNIGKRSEIGRPVFPHLFRHSVATDMIQRKVPVTVVQKLLGHASVNTTLIYAKMLDTDVKDSHTRTVV